MSKTVLIVDDQLSLRRIIVNMLSSEGWTCVEAESLAKAQEQLKTHTPQLFIIDHYVGGSDGADVLKALQALPAYQKTPALFVVQDEPGKILSGLMSGFVSYIVKPFSSEQLLEKVKKVLG